MGNSESRGATTPSSSTKLRAKRRALTPQSSEAPHDDSDEPKDGQAAITTTLRRRSRLSSSSSCSSDDSLARERGGLERGQEALEETSAQLSYWYLLKHGYTELVHLIIRPPRTTYDPVDLGPRQFLFTGRTYVREDFVVVNDRSQKLVCSHWRPAVPLAQVGIEGDTLVPCVVYLHGNSSCRLEALGILRTCLAAGLTVAAFDTAGCGHSEGEYISLGYYERDDLRDVVTHLRTKMNIGTVALWGRSMGAATALLHADRDPSIAGIVVDSAFASLEQLVEEVVDRGRQEGMTLPGFLVKIVLKFIRLSVKKRAHFDLQQLAPIDHAPVSFVPALFVAAEHDSFIGPHHSDQIFAAYGGDKNLVKVNGDHNSSRPQFLLDSAAIFLQTSLQVEAAATLPTSVFAHGTIGGGARVPWEDATGRTSSFSMCSTPSSRCHMTTDFDARHFGTNLMLLPTEPWSCPSCSFVNRPPSMQCKMCRDIHLPDDGTNRDVRDEEDETTFGEATRIRATTTAAARPPFVSTQSQAASRRRTLETAPSFSPSTLSLRSGQQFAGSERSMGVVTVTTKATSVPTRTTSPPSVIEEGQKS
uniref:RanBP2-type domain-containing protein n=1 Tax=Peronospora matthiolae TaxID=2874970 RepID=A0AAV1TBR5_9STRA